jgi:hypothetical protein
MFQSNANHDGIFCRHVDELEIPVMKSSCVLESRGSADPMSKVSNAVDDFVALKNRLPMDYDAAYRETVLAVGGVQFLSHHGLDGISPKRNHRTKLVLHCV